MLAISDSKQLRRRFNENQTNLNLFQKFLGQLSKLLDQPSAKQEMENLRGINKDIYREVRNPYLRLFMILAIERDTYKELFSQIAESSAINLLDYVTLACKYLDKQSLVACLKRKLQYSINNGLLDAIPLVGLESGDLARVLSNFNDETADVQTCAYVAAFACTSQFLAATDGKSESNQVKLQTPGIAPLKRFI